MLKFNDSRNGIDGIAASLFDAGFKTNEAIKNVNEAGNAFLIVHV